jgi:hypothetical protein
MKYKVNTLDGRFKYRKWFKYYIGFSTSMINDQGPMQFNRALQWFFDTYGWSAEIRQWTEIRSWYINGIPMMAIKGGRIRPDLEILPSECNMNWSWTNGMGDLRIYIKGDAELAFFQLAHPLTNS